MRNILIITFYEKVSHKMSEFSKDFLTFQTRPPLQAPCGLSEAESMMGVVPAGTGCWCDGSGLWWFGAGGVAGVGWRAQNAGLYGHHRSGWNWDLKIESYEPQFRFVSCSPYLPPVSVKLGVLLQIWSLC